MSTPTVNGRFLKKGALAVNSGDHNEIALADDPKRLIEQVVAMGSEFPGPAEDLLLSWMLSLAPETDAPASARRLVARYGGDAGMNWAEGSPIAKLFLLLQQTGQADPKRGRRQGGAQARRRN